MKKLAGRVAYVTGASKGIGEGIARVLAKHGAQVILIARSDLVFKTAKSIEADYFQRSISFNEAH
jgi:NAD(P)-dependent dehydrogenase (short-subunit alcohol dehydrogenase family)